MIAYFVVIQYCQFEVIDFYIHNGGSYVPYAYNYMVWLLYEVVLFYINIISQIIFLFLSRLFPFRTVKEKFVEGFSKKMRYRVDFLDFVKDDIHWFQITVHQIFLAWYAYKKR